MSELDCIVLSTQDLMLVLFSDLIFFPEKVFIDLNSKLLLLEIDQATQRVFQWQTYSGQEIILGRAFTLLP